MVIMAFASFKIQFDPETRNMARFHMALVLASGAKVLYSHGMESIPFWQRQGE
ncbi:MAG: hypothetical protein ACE15F_20130 [bacterium]